MNVGINDIFMEYGNALPNLVSSNMAGWKVAELNGVPPIYGWSRMEQKHLSMDNFRGDSQIQTYQMEEMTNQKNDEALIKHTSINLFECEVSE